MSGTSGSSGSSGFVLWMGVEIPPPLSTGVPAPPVIEPAFCPRLPLPVKTVMVSETVPPPPCIGSGLRTITRMRVTVPAGTVCVLL